MNRNTENTVFLVICSQYDSQTPFKDVGTRTMLHTQ